VEYSRIFVLKSYIALTPSHYNLNTNIKELTKYQTHTKSEIRQPNLILSNILHMLFKFAHINFLKPISNYTEIVDPPYIRMVDVLDDRISDGFYFPSFLSRSIS
jgi:hypothetical protein